MNATTKRSTLAAGCALGLVLGAGSHGALAAEPAPGDAPAATLENSIERLSVPEVRQNPDSRTIEPAFLRLRGEGDGAPTFVFFGGPGESVLDYGSLDALRAAHAHLLAHGDVVFIEQRGVGASRPNLDCEPLQFPLDEALTTEGVVSAYADALTACVETSGADMRGYTSVEIADDAEDVRRTLGYERINVMGGSYGAQQAYYYVRRHGAHVDRAVLTQLVSPESSLASPAAIDDYIVQIGDRIGPSMGIAEGGGAMLAQMIGGVFAQVEAAPLAVEAGGVEFTIGRTDLEIITALALRRTQTTAMLPSLYLQMSNGDFSSVAPFMLQFVRGSVPVNAAVIAFDCAAIGDAERLERFAAEAEASLSGLGAHLPLPGACAGLGHGQVDSAYRAPGDLHGVRILVIQAELDARARDEVLAPFFADGETARMLVIGNASHDLGRSASATIGGRLDDIAARFLGDGDWPEETEIVLPLAGE